MKLSLQTDYSLRTLMFLASRPGRQTVQGVARYFQVSEPHIAKVVNQLARLGFIRTIRGIGGGIELRKAPSEISLGEVILAVEGNMNLLDCLTVEKVCRIQPFCRLQGVMAQAQKLQLDYFRSVSINDIIPIPTEAQLELTPLEDVEPASAP